MVSPNTQYEYDPLYRLLQADGREHAGQGANAQRDHTDIPRMPLPHPNNGQAMRNYTESYDYDEVGNIEKMIHQATNGNWTRHYAYAPDSNRLLATSLPGDDPLGSYSSVYEYDTHGNMTVMPHLKGVQWDFKDQMRQVDLGGGGIAYYVYDSSGQRLRKVHQHNSSMVEERIYLDGYEIYRQRNGHGLTLERETLHIMDDQKRVALVETKTQGKGAANYSAVSLSRYQLDNHLSSVSLELNKVGALISYEEYHPYGTTAYHATRNRVEVSTKRYRFTHKERDEESGLYYHIARYYAPWVARWVSCDPIGMSGGINLYSYVQNNSINNYDPTGQQGESAGKEVTIYHATSPSNAAKVVKAPKIANSEDLTKTNRPKHTWAGRGLYANSEKVSSYAKPGNAIVGIKVAVDDIADISKFKYSLAFQETDNGLELRRTLYQRAKSEGLSYDKFMDREIRKYLKQTNQLDKRVISYEVRDGSYNYVVKSRQAIRSSKILGDVNSSRRFSPRQQGGGAGSGGSGIRSSLRPSSIALGISSGLGYYFDYKQISSKETISGQAKEAAAVGGRWVGAALGAKYGSSLGPKGAIAGAILGGMIGENGIRAVSEFIGSIEIPEHEPAGFIPPPHDMRTRGAFENAPGTVIRP